MPYEFQNMTSVRSSAGQNRDNLKLWRLFGPAWLETQPTSAESSSSSLGSSSETDSPSASMASGSTRDAVRSLRLRAGGIPRQEHADPVPHIARDCGLLLSPGVREPLREITTGFSIYDFSTDRRTSRFGLPGGPEWPGNLPKIWRLAPPIFLEGFLAARGRPNSTKVDVLWSAKKPY